MKKYILAIDPGREKTGLAILDLVGNPIFHEIIESADLLNKVEEAIVAYKIDVIVLGDGTSSKDKLKHLQEVFPQITIRVVNEYGTTEEGRKIYFAMHPPKGLKRFIPLGMQTPPGPIDDYAAIAIGRRYLKEK